MAAETGKRRSKDVGFGEKKIASERNQPGGRGGTFPLEKRKYEGGGVLRWEEMACRGAQGGKERREGKSRENADRRKPETNSRNAKGPLKGGGKKSREVPWGGKRN